MGVSIDFTIFVADGADLGRRVLDAIQEPLAALEVFARNAIGGETQKAKRSPKRRASVA